MPLNMNVLPLYVVVLAVSPAVLWLLRKMPALALALVATVYAAANLFGLNFPSSPHGYWYFNPLAWQFLFVLGAWCGLAAAEHFLALAIVADWLIPRDWPPLTWRVLRPLILCGQHSLEVVCLGGRWPSPGSRRGRSAGQRHHSLPGGGGRHRGDGRGQCAVELVQLHARVVPDSGQCRRGEG
jgi:hypothetical protein